MRRIASLAALVACAVTLNACRWPRLGPEPPPPPPTGSGSVDAEYRFLAPDFELRLASAGQAAPDRYGAPQQPANIGIFQGETYVTGKLMASLSPVGQGDGIWSVPLHFDNLPLGSLSLSRYEEYQGWLSNNLYRQRRGAGTAFALSKAEPSASAVVLEDNFWRSEPGIEVPLRLLASGNGRGGWSFQLQGETNSVDEAGQVSLAFQGKDSAPFGRYFARLSHLKAGSYSLGYFGGGRLLLDGLATGAYSVALDGDNDPRIALYYTSTLPAAPPGAGPDETAAHSGSIRFTVNLTGALVWDYDLLVAAEPAPGQAGLFPAWAHILPMDVGLGKKLEGSLAYLDPGRYDISAYRLGADNSVAPERLGGAGTEVELVLPPLETAVDYQGKEYSYQPAPQASVSFGLEL